MIYFMFYDRNVLILIHFGLLTQYGPLHQMRQMLGLQGKKIDHIINEIR